VTIQALSVKPFCFVVASLLLGFLPGTASAAVSDQESFLYQALNSPKKSVRMEAIRSLTGDEDLARLAREGDWFIRRLAVTKIADQSVLAEIALKDPDWAVREEATSRLINQDVLYTIAERDTSKAVRMRAVRTLLDPVYLKRLALWSSYGDVRKQALLLITDDGMILDVVRNSSHEAIRKLGISLLKDQAFVRELVNGKDRQLHELAVPFLRDQNLLKKVAEDVKEEEETRIKAVSALNDQDTLQRLALHGNSPGLRIAAVSRMQNVKVLEKLALKDRNPGIRIASLRFLSDQPIMARVYKNDSDAGVRAEAVRRMTDQPLLEKIAATEPTEEIRVCAVERLARQSALMKIFLTDKAGPVRYAALRKLKRVEEEVLVKSATGDPYPMVRREAVSRLSDQKLLLSILQKDPSFSVRMAALQRITDPRLLAEIAQKDVRWVTRLETVKKITDEAALATVAGRDEDFDVREASLGEIEDQKTIFPLVRDSGSKPVGLQATSFLTNPVFLKTAATGKFPIGVRLEAVSLMTDPVELTSIALSNADEQVRLAAVKRLLNPSAKPVGNIKERLKLMLLDPVLTRLRGEMNLSFEREWEERRYADYGGKDVYPPKRGRAYVEQIRILVSEPGGKVLCRREFMGKRAGKAEHFDDQLPLLNGYRVKYKRARVDLLQIARDLLKDLERTDLQALSKSRNKYLHTAAEELLNP